MSKDAHVTLASVLGLLLSAAPLAAQGGSLAAAPAQTPVPTFSSEVEIVTVDAVVLDPGGKPVSTLTREDFRLLENGKPQEIVHFEAVEVSATRTVASSAPTRITSNVATPSRSGRSFAIVFDGLHVCPSSVARTQAAVSEFARNTLRDGDRVTLATTSGDLSWSTVLPEGRDDLLALAPRLTARLAEASLDSMSEYEAREIVHEKAEVTTRVVNRWQAAGVCLADCGQMVGMRARQIWGEAAVRTQATLLTVHGLLREMAAQRGRKSLILLSEGFLTEEGSRDVEAVVEASRLANAGLYFVDARGLVSLSREEEASQRGTQASGSAQGAQDRTRATFDDEVGPTAAVEQIADDTGGFSIRRRNDLAASLGRIGEESRVYYLLGYQPADGARDRRFRRIAVSVGREGLKVRARKGYYPGADVVDTGQKQASRKPAARDQRLAAPSLAAEVPLRVASFVFDEKSPGKARVMLLADVDSRALTFEKGTAVLEIEVSVQARDGGPTLRNREKVTLQAKEEQPAIWRSTIRELELPSGVLQAAVTLRDARSGAIGRVAHRFAVPDLSELRVSTPILTDLVETAAESGGRPRPVLTARRTFDGGGRLYCQFEVYRPKRQEKTAPGPVSAGYVLTKDGKPQRWSQPAPITSSADGRAVRLIGMPLEGMPAGSYDLALIVEDGATGKRLEVHEPFSIEAAAAAPSARATATATR